MGSRSNHILHSKFEIKNLGIYMMSLTRRRQIISKDTPDKIHYELGEYQPHVITRGQRNQPEEEKNVFSGIWKPIQRGFNVLKSALTGDLGRTEIPRLLPGVNNKNVNNHTKNQGSIMQNLVNKQNVSPATLDRSDFGLYKTVKTKPTDSYNSSQYYENSAKNLPITDRISNFIGENKVPLIATAVAIPALVAGAYGIHKLVNPNR